MKRRLSARPRLRHGFGLLAVVGLAALAPRGAAAQQPPPGDEDPPAPGYAAARTTDLRLVAGRYVARGDLDRSATPEQGEAVFTELDAEIGYFVADGLRMALSFGRTSPGVEYDAWGPPEAALQVGLHVRKVWGRPAPFGEGSGWLRLRPFVGGQVFFGPFDPRVAVSGGLVWPITEHFGFDVGVRASSRRLAEHAEAEVELGVGVGLFLFRWGRAPGPARPPEPTTRVGEVVRPDAD